jgi:hypothetical protein
MKRKSLNNEGDAGIRWRASEEERQLGEGEAKISSYTTFEDQGLPDRNLEGGAILAA